MNEKEILNISNYKDIFNSNEDENKVLYKELVKRFHPDSNKEDTTHVFMHIAMLYKKSKSGDKNNYEELIKESGGIAKFIYLTQYEFELGTCYICNKHIVYLLNSDKEKYYANAINNMKNFHYADIVMEKEFSRLLPKLVSDYKTQDGKYCIVLSKTEDIYPLKSVYEYFNKKIADKHVAWILSRLNNLNCFFDYAGIVHNGINIDNCFVSTEYHSIVLLGGWWYATKKDEKMIGTTKEIFDVMPIYAKSNKVSKIETDIEAVKLVGRTLLGESKCRKISLDEDIPKQIRNFLISGSSKDAVKEMMKWDDALTMAYGKREFIKLEILPDAIYK